MVQVGSLFQWFVKWTSTADTNVKNKNHYCIITIANQRQLQDLEAVNKEAKLKFPAQFSFSSTVSRYPAVVARAPLTGQVRLHQDQST